MVKFSQKMDVATTAVGRGILRAACSLTAGKFGRNAIFNAYKNRSEQLEQEAKLERFDAKHYAKAIRMSANARKYVPEKSVEAAALLANEQKMWRKIASQNADDPIRVLEKVPFCRFPLYLMRSNALREKISDAFQDKYCLDEGNMITIKNRKFGTMMELERITLHKRRQIDRFGVFIENVAGDRYVTHIRHDSSDGGFWTTGSL